VAEPWRDDGLDDEGESNQAIKRILAALRRYKLLLMLGVVVGAGAGTIAYRMGAPVYQAAGSFWLVNENRDELAGPLQQGVLMSPQAFTDLMRSGAVLNPVVVKERLYLQTSLEDRQALSGFRVDANGYAPGKYRLTVGLDGRTWTLATSEGATVATGRVGEPIGRELGFLWEPTSADLRPQAEVDFTVVTPQDAARDLRQRIQATVTRDGNFINLWLRGEDANRIASILESVMEQLRVVAGDLKTAKLDSAIASLQVQLERAQGNLDQARSNLEAFKIATITLPSEVSGAVAPGLMQTQNTVFSDFLNKRVQRDAYTQDRRRLEALLAEIPEQGVRVEAFEVIPAVQNATEFKQALGALVENRATLRTLLQDYKDAYLPVQELRDNIEQSEQRDIPTLTRALIAQLRSQEQQLGSLLDARADELQQIPPRTIQEATLTQDVNTAQTLYNNVLNRLDQNRLAKASTQPDLQVIDVPSVPEVPAEDERIRWFLLAFLGSVALGAGIAVALDHFDPRLRYPTEVSRVMGLEILGAVPRVTTRRRGNAEVVLEAFREIRMRVQYAYGNARPLLLAVTSSESGEGKTFVTANLGITFAQLGRKTLVIDGDTRRGDMHDLFEMDRKPGLTDLFRRKVDGSVIQRTKHENLHFLACGSRSTESPDLLSSGEMQELLAAAKRRYEVILIDCPPMAAGSDAFILGAHAGSVLVVLRSGSTHKELARAKMEAFYRLPVRLLGAVLNDIDAGSSYGAYRYYSYYLPGYRAGEEEEETRVVAM
jgi:capsular exopolysaccharide synthesis family protein